MNLAFLYAVVREQITVERVVVFLTPIIGSAVAYLVGLVAKAGLNLDPGQVTALAISVVTSLTVAAFKYLDLRADYNATPQGQRDEDIRQEIAEDRKERAKR